MTNTIEAPQKPCLPSERATRRRRVMRKAPLRAADICADILDNTGPIGKRMREKDETTLAEELLRRTPHPLLKRALRFTELMLPTEHFRREDKDTPYIRHSLRTALFLQDYLLQTNLDGYTQAILLSIMLTHDNEEEAQEHLMEGKPGGRTQEETKKLFYECMEGLPPELRIATDYIYEGMHLFNRHNPDNSKKDNKQYLREIREAGYGMLKIIDRGNDSPWGDLSRIAGALIDTIENKRSELPSELERYHARSLKSANKAKGLRELARSVPEQFELDLEATIISAALFREAVNEIFAKKKKGYQNDENIII